MAILLFVQNDKRRQNDKRKRDEKRRQDEAQVRGSLSRSVGEPAFHQPGLLLDNRNWASLKN
jgi:hypothetical protein